MGTLPASTASTEKEDNRLLGNWLTTVVAVGAVLGAALLVFACAAYVWCLVLRKRKLVPGGKHIVPTTDVENPDHESEAENKSVTASEDGSIDGEGEEQTETKTETPEE